MSPSFPLGGFSRLQSSALDASSLRATPKQVALAWLLQRSPNILLIPGTSSVKHLRENLNAATLHIPSEMIADLGRSSAASVFGIQSFADFRCRRLFASEYETRATA